MVKKSPEQILKAYIRKCCLASWRARTMRKMTSPPHGYKLKYKTFNDWWRKMGLRNKKQPKREGE